MAEQRYVDTASTSGGDGTAQGHTGATRAYASLSEWESTEQGIDSDLTGDGNHTVSCAGSTNDTTVVSILGWTTTTNDRIIVEGDATAPDGDGVNTGAAFNSSFYVIDASGTNNRAIAVQEDFVTIRNIQVRMVSTTGGTARGITANAQAASNEVLIQNVRVSRDDAEVATRHGIEAADPELIITIENCTLECGSINGTVRGVQVSNCTTANIRNIVSEGWDTGVRANGGTTVNLDNSLIFNNGTDVEGGATTFNVRENAADQDLDTDLSGTGNEIIGTDIGAIGTLVTNSATGDFTILDASSDLIGLGSAGNRSALDILGANWDTNDIGAHAWPAAVGGGATHAKLAGHGGLAGLGGLAGRHGGLAG